MFKKIIKNKSLFISLLTFCFSLFCFVTIGYAWIAISKDAGVDDFVGVVENQEINYQFSQVIDGSLTPVKEIKTENVIPGQVNTFALTVTNKGTNDVIVNISFTDVFSELYNEVDKAFSNNYDNRYKKVQYAYSFNLALLAYAPDNTIIENVDDPSLVVVPTPEVVSNKGWEEIKRDQTSNYFNKVNNDEGFTDVKNYELVNQLLKPSIKSSSDVNNQSTLVVYFTIKFNSTPVFDPLIADAAPKDIDFDGEYYANQRFNISHITIQGIE